MKGKDKNKKIKIDMSHQTQLELSATAFGILVKFQKLSSNQFK